MEKFCKVMKYIFTIICMLSFVFMCSVDAEGDNWFNLLIISFVVFLTSYLLAAFCYNRHPIVKKVCAILCYLYVAYVLKFRRNSKEGRMFVKTFTYRYNNSKINFKKVADYSYRAYDLNHSKEGL